MTKPRRYRKKPVVLDSAQFLGFDQNTGGVLFDHRPKWLVDEFGENILFFNNINCLDIKTLEGTIEAKVGDYIVRGIKGELYPVDEEIFNELYEEVDD